MLKSFFMVTLLPFFHITSGLELEVSNLTLNGRAVEKSPKDVALFQHKTGSYSTDRRYPSNANAKHAHVFCVNAFSKTR